MEKTVIYLPASLARIESEAFAGTSADIYELPVSVTYIGPRAFADLEKDALVRIPAVSVVEIDDTAFEGSSVTIVCLAGSPAEAWAAEKGISCVNP